MAALAPSKQGQLAITKVLIANRGEIACRIIRTCRRLGIATVAVYSDADRNARHVRLADYAVHVGEAAPGASYLRQEQLLQVALDQGAQAVHPGYGFLSENTSFARRVHEAGLVFIGPSVHTIERMGSKAEAKITMRAAGVPCVPGYDGANQDPSALGEEAQKVGYPLLIKASAGGGGKGMRVVRKAQDFAAALAAARREAASAFGDEHVILERFLAEPRHVEFQIFGDSHGQVVHLFERDCSSQRRYQKVIEETPSPAINDAMRTAMGRAAVAAAQAVNYVGAGTVEFIVQGEEFFFMEMNTRLQVEHPVTELVIGQDLVEWQLRVAAGETLPLRQEQIQSRGHALEVRLYAEDPNTGFLPSTGRLERLQLPYGLEQVRVDSGVEQGDSVSVHYDPMIAKIICWGENRDSALARMTEALAHTYVVGLKTNLGFLARLIQLPLFRAGQIHTTYIDQALESLLAVDSQAQYQASLLACAARLVLESAAATTPALPSRADRPADHPADPWASRDAWSNTGMLKRSWTLDDGQQQSHWQLRYVATQAGPGHGHGYPIWQITDEHGQQHEIAHNRLQHNEQGVGELSVLIDGCGQRAQVHFHKTQLSLHHQGQLWSFQWRSADEHDSGQSDHGGSLVAPMPGKIIAVNVQAGDTVSADQALVVMEAMKMEITLRAPSAGKVINIRHSVGEQVEADTLLVELEEA